MKKDWTNNYIGTKEYFNSPKVCEIYKVYTLILKYLIDNPTRKFFFSITKIAQILNIPYQTVYSALKRLERDELISINNEKQTIKYKGNEYEIYREININFKKAKEIMQITALDSKAYKSLSKRRYRKLCKQRLLTYIVDKDKVYKRYIEETGYAKYKSFKQMFLEFCKNVSNKYFKINYNYISLEETNMFTEEESKLVRIIDDPIPETDFVNNLISLFKSKQKANI